VMFSHLRSADSLTEEANVFTYAVPRTILIVAVQTPLVSAANVAVPLNGDLWYG